MMRAYDTSIGLLELDTDKPLTAAEAEKIAKNMLGTVKETDVEKRQAIEHDKED